MGVIAREAGAAAQPREVSRNAVNFWIDLVTALAFTVLLGTSFIMKFILPPGTCDEVGKVKVWLGHSRHWWGDIHFWTAVLMLALILVHIWLHWNWVKGLWGKLLGRTYAPRSLAMLTLMAGAMAVPFIIPHQYIAAENSATAAAEGSVETAQAAVAPCGVEGLSCDTCPAASDRLFGGGCATGEEAAEEETPAEGPAGEESACTSCPNAELCEILKETEAETE